MTILLVDNYDSFTFNLAQILHRHDQVQVVRNDQVTRDEIDDLAPTAIVLSPGPGHPANARDVGVCAALIEEPFAGPMLGVCLGMQAMAHYTGGTVERAPALVHGEADSIECAKDPLFDGLPSTLQVGRYHSLCVTQAPSWQSLAHSADGTLMAMRHMQRPWVGVQFHPESILSPDGDRLVANFLGARHEC